jgi:hypothetical protein
MKRGDWFRYRPEPEKETALGAAMKLFIGVAIGGIAYAMGAQTLAIFIWVVAGIIGLVTLGSQHARSQVGRFFAAIGRGLGWLLAVVLLTPVYLVGFTAARVICRIAGRDPLHLRERESHTFWLPVDHDHRKVRHIRSLFATEALVPSRGTGIVWLTSLAALLVAAEVVLRILGFGNAILYQPHAQAGFFPGPHQDVRRYGGRVTTNAYGMRAPDFEKAKRPGTLRIFMLGDSTLYGGSFVDQPDLYARRLESSLDRQFGPANVEVLNMGVNAWGPFNKLGYVEAFGTFDADIAIICLPIGDVYRDLAHLWMVPFMPVGNGPRCALEEVLHHLNWRSRQWGKRQEILANRQAQGEKGIAAYVELAEKLKDRGCEVLVEILPSEEAGMTDVIPADQKAAVEKLTAALTAKGFKVGYPAGLFRGQGDADEIYRDPVHLASPGHAIYAKYLESRLQNESERFRSWAKSLPVAATDRSTAAP